MQAHYAYLQGEYGESLGIAETALAREDDLIEAFGEHHGLLETTLKKDDPEDFKRIISITYNFSGGWRKVHNPNTGHDVADNLTTTEFAVAMLAARGWTYQEISTHMEITVNTVKAHMK
ncbi:MAG: LuxR C-terminal-related transcriptional regulator [Lachnospiraceae bacterium]|nr:LuxR C-terminal-related transcriptional regulator [Lachnospiraceae bacterium]